MGFVFFLIFLLGIGLVIAFIAFFLLLIVGFVFFLIMGINLRKTEKKRSTGYFIAAGVAFVIIAYIAQACLYSAGAMTGANRSSPDSSPFDSAAASITASTET